MKKQKWNDRTAHEFSIKDQICEDLPLPESTAHM